MLGWNEDDACMEYHPTELGEYIWAITHSDHLHSRPHRENAFVDFPPQREVLPSSPLQH
jgi:hypothetical protein